MASITSTVGLGAAATARSTRRAGGDTVSSRSAIRSRSDSGTGSGPTRRGVLTGADERAAELDGEQRVPAGRLREADERRPAEHVVEVVAQEVVQRAEAERPDVDAQVAVDAVEPERERPARAAPHGRRHADALRREAPERVREDLDRRRVEPLDVVDGDQERPVLRQSVEERARADRHRLGRQGVTRPGPQERDLDRLPLRDRELGELRLGRGEEVGDRRVPEQPLVLGRLGHQYPPAPLDRALDDPPPQDGLADARLAHQRQQARTLAEGVEPVRDGAPFDIPARHRRPHDERLQTPRSPRRFVRGGSGQPRPSKVRFRMSSCSWTWMVWLPVAGLPEPTRDTSR